MKTKGKLIKFNWILMNYFGLRRLTQPLQITFYV